MLRAAWRAHGGAVGRRARAVRDGLTRRAVRRALTLADGMRNGQQLGALLGYLLERGIHDASGVTDASGLEIDWVVFELRRQFPLKVDTIDNAPQASAQRLVADGWKLAQAETGASPGAVVRGVPAPTGAGHADRSARAENRRAAGGDRRRRRDARRASRTSASPSRCTSSPARTSSAPPPRPT